MLGVETRLLHIPIHAAENLPIRRFRTVSAYRSIPDAAAVPADIYPPDSILRQYGKALNTETGPFTIRLPLQGKPGERHSYGKVGAACGNDAKKTNFACNGIPPECIMRISG